MFIVIPRANGKRNIGWLDGTDLSEDAITLIRESALEPEAPGGVVRCCGVRALLPYDHRDLVGLGYGPVSRLPGDAAASESRTCCRVVDPGRRHGLGRSARRQLALLTKLGRGGDRWRQ